MSDEPHELKPWVIQTPNGVYECSESPNWPLMTFVDTGSRQHLRTVYHPLVNEHYYGSEVQIAFALEVAIGEGHVRVFNWLLRRAKVSVDVGGGVVLARAVENYVTKPSETTLAAYSAVNEAMPNFNIWPYEGGPLHWLAQCEPEQDRDALAVAQTMFVRSKERRVNPCLLHDSEFAHQVAERRGLPLLAYFLHSKFDEEVSKGQ